YYYPNYQMQQNQPTQNNQGLIWVSGEAGAKAYLVAPNTTVQLWDSESQTIFVKSADASGMPSMKVLEYKIKGNTPESPINERRGEFATKEDIYALQNKYAEIERKIAEIGGAHESVVQSDK
ncbi:MAG: hypothetical protein J6D29_01645, partial [Solobacterium sp.]|nr:hypothetical protein [Solobacterium sp.]